MNLSIPTWKDIQRAHDRVGKQVKKTPVFSSSSINKLYGLDLYYKCENFQKTGSFKFRGASNAVLSLSKEEAIREIKNNKNSQFEPKIADLLLQIVE